MYFPKPQGGQGQGGSAVVLRPDRNTGNRPATASGALAINDVRTGTGGTGQGGALTQTGP